MKLYLITREYEGEFFPYLIFLNENKRDIYLAKIKQDAFDNDLDEEFDTDEILTSDSEVK